ncbi:MAG: UxaA family hydrolase [Acidimicrobiales bacterium]
MTTVQLHHTDNVDIQVGDDGTVPNGHKQARGAIAVGEEIRKGGVTIGKASSPIASGDHVHEHNVDVWRATNTASAAATDLRAPDPVEPRTFDGYHRADGRVGIRNHILILTTVNCSPSLKLATNSEMDRQIRPDCDSGLASLAKCDRVLVDDFTR